MTAVWYIGTANTRTIVDSDWDRALGANTYGDVTWNRENGWSIPTAQFNAAQLNYITTLKDFVTGAPDGPRVLPNLPNNSPDQGQAYVYYMAIKAIYDEITAILEPGDTVRTDLLLARDANTVQINSSSGDDVSIPTATASLAGILTSAMYTKLFNSLTPSEIAALYTTPAQVDTKIAKRVNNLTNVTSVDVNCEAYDQVIDLSITGAITLNNPTGIPKIGQLLWYTLQGTATRAITYGTAFEDSTVFRPNATSSANQLDLGFRWNHVTSKWRLIAVA